jgi:hypothetical protein
VTLDECLDAVLADLEYDHWKLAFALGGYVGEAPADPDLAALHGAVAAHETSCDLLDVVYEHPEAAARHMMWVMETLHRNGPPSARCSVSATTADLLPIAS